MPTDDYPSPPSVRELDVYRSANVLVKEYGAEAPIIAAMRADAMLARGDLDGYAVWRRILWAVKELGRQEPDEGEARH